MSLSPETQHLETKLDFHLDLEHLQQISEGSSEFEQELLKIFWEDSCHHLGVLREAIAQSNLAQINRTIHHLKGSSANVGAKRVRAIATQLERHYNRSASTLVALSTAGSELSELEHSLDQIETWLQRHKI
jgi:HPt (histidine-containing phosphotransfer) domain-containing protein